MLREIAKAVLAKGQASIMSAFAASTSNMQAIL
jgi:hypothetical protein